MNTPIQSTCYTVSFVTKAPDFDFCNDGATHLLHSREIIRAKGANRTTIKQLADMENIKPFIPWRMCGEVVKGPECWYLSVTSIQTDIGQETSGPGKDQIPFKPYLSLVAKGDGMTLVALVYAPNSCFSKEKPSIGMPAGMVTVPEVLPVVLPVIPDSAATICLNYLMPLEYHLPLKTSDLNGKQGIVAYSTLNGVVVGQNSIILGNSEAAIQTLTGNTVKVLQRGDGLPWPGVMLRDSNV
jgi:hypothetical protein